MSEKLLGEFPPVSTAAWEAAMAKDLKDAGYEEKPIWRTPEGLAVRPYHRAEDVAGLGWADAAPGVFPFARGTRAGGGWRIREEVEAADPGEANRAALAAAAAGAEEIAFRNAAIANASDLALAVSNLEIPAHFADAGEELLRLLAGLAIQGQRRRAISAGFDPLANVDLAAEAMAAAPAGFAPFAIDVSRRNRAGGSAVEELGLTLAAGVDFLAAMDERGGDIDRAAGAVEFSFAIGCNFFVEIAKLRAFRLLWARAVESFGGARESAKARIAAHTSRHQETPDTEHMNILRGTTQAMAAALGGADSITVAPFAAPGSAWSEASRRLARNTQLLLKHEAMLARVADPGGGSYSLESITDSMAGAAWKRMQEAEARGGFLKAQAA